MGHLGHKDSHTRFHVREVEAEVHLILLRIERGKVVVNLLLRHQEVGQFPFYTHKEDVLHMVHILVQVDDITFVHRDKICHFCQDARTVGAVEQQLGCFRHSCFLFLSRLLFRLQHFCLECAKITIYCKSKNYLSKKFAFLPQKLHLRLSFLSSHLP